jgi:hypothetical protein
MSDKRIERLPGGQVFEARSYYDEEIGRHFALVPPGDEKWSRIVLPCSVLDLSEDQLAALMSTYSAIQRLKWATSDQPASA